ncbi:MAG: WG repeat-containing protein, partial [Bryobacteraceae bacterium]
MFALVREVRRVLLAEAADSQPLKRAHEPHLKVLFPVLQNGWAGPAASSGTSPRTGRSKSIRSTIRRPFFQEGLAAVSIGDLRGHINLHGKIAVNPQFEEAGGFSNGL